LEVPTLWLLCHKVLGLTQTKFGAIIHYELQKAQRILLHTKLENEMTNKFKPGTVVSFGWRGPGKINYNCGVVLPYHNRFNNLFILSDYDCGVHMMRQTTRGPWVLANEKRHDPKLRLDMRALTEAEKQQLGPIGLPFVANFQNWALHYAHIDPNNTEAEWEAYQRGGGLTHNY
jgi:hypothetical protein